MKELLRQAFIAGFDRSGEGYNAEYPFAHNEDEMWEKLEQNFEFWYDENVVDFECVDCGKSVVRPRNENVDIEGVTPVRCGSCTLDRMAE